MDYEKIFNLKDGILLYKVKNFSLRQTLDNGQAFRWFFDNGYWYGIVNDKVLQMFNTLGHSVIITNITKEEFETTYKYYFDLDKDYDSIKSTFYKDDVFSNIVPKSTGLRILNQDILETIISFIISANNNIPRIKNSIRSLCERYGTRIDMYSKVFFTFPDLITLKTLSLDDWRELGVGYRDLYLKSTVNILSEIVEEYGSLKEFYSGFNYEECRTVLKTLQGVGNKVADCICLFSLKHMNAFPIDTWVEKILLNKYKLKYINDPEIRENMNKRFDNMAGYAQQFMFYYYRGGN